MRFVFITALTLLLSSCGFHVKLTSNDKSIEASGYLYKPVIVTATK